MSSRNTGQTVLAVAARTILVLVLLAYLVPIIWMYSSSMRTNGEIILDPLGLPTRLDFQNHITAWEMAKLGRHFFISIVITSVSMIMVVSFSSLAAWRR